MLATAGLLALPGAAFAGDYPCPETPAQPAEPSTGDTACEPLLETSGALDLSLCLDLDASAAGQTVTVD